MRNRYNKFRIGNLALFVGGFDITEYEDLQILQPRYYEMQNCIIVSEKSDRWSELFRPPFLKKINDVVMISWNIFLQNDGVIINAYPKDLRKLQKSPFRRDHKRKMK